MLKFKREEINDLNFQILEFTLPRLKQFRETCTNYPADLSMDLWKEELAEMIKEIEVSIETEDCNVPTFQRYFNHLWI